MSTNTSNEHKFRVDLIIENASGQVHMERRFYDIYAANHGSASAVAWACIEQDQKALLDAGNRGANTCRFNTIIPGDPYRQ